jgi:hypothetical protein
MGYGLSGERTAIEELVTLEGLNPYDHLWATRPGGGRVRHDRPIGNSGFQIWWTAALKPRSVTANPTRPATPTRRPGASGASPSTTSN